MAYSYLTVFQDPGPKTKVKMLSFDALTGSFTPGNTIYQTVSGVLVAYATVDTVYVVSTAGELALSSVWGTFQNNEIIYESALGSELVTNGNFTNWTGDNPNNWSLNFVEDGTNYVTENPAGKCQSITDAIGKSIYQIILTTNAFYKYSIDIDTIASGQVSLSDFSAEIIVYTSTGTKTGVWQAQNIFFGIGNGLVAVGNFTVDNASIKQITNAALANGTLREIYLEGWKNF